MSRLNREKIIDAAIALADSSGLEGLTMRSLADHLGVKAMSLYNHVKNRDFIIDEMVDRVVGEMALPSPGPDWLAALRWRTLSAYAVLKKHPWASMALVSRVNTGPAMLRYMEETLAVFVAAGFTEPDADHGWNALDSYLHGFVLYELRFPFEPAQYREGAARYLPSIPEDRYPHFVSLGRQVVAGTYDGLRSLEFGLDCLLEGLRRRHEGS